MGECNVGRRSGHKEVTMTGGYEGESKERKCPECDGRKERQPQQQECNRQGLIHGELDGVLQTMAPFEGVFKSIKSISSGEDFFFQCEKEKENSNVKYNVIYVQFLEKVQNTIPRGLDRQMDTF